MFLRRKIFYGVSLFIFVAFIRAFYLSITQADTVIPAIVVPPVKSSYATYGVKDITFVIRLPDNQLDVAKQFFNGSYRVLLITDNMFKPKDLKNKPNIKHAYVGIDLLNPSVPKDPLDNVDTDFIFLPVSFPRSLSNEEAKNLIKRAKKYPEDILIIQYRNKPSLQCMSIGLNLKQWTLEYKPEKSCTAARGNFALFGKKSALEPLNSPWLQPFPEAIFIEAAARGINVRLVENFNLARGKYKANWDNRKKILDRLEMFDKFKVKKVIRSGVVEWYGCTRNTTRCFGTIHNDTPDYLMQGRWTPPCCLRVLRQTARHVFRALEYHKVRYWLEGGSLLGAMRSGDIIPWDYDIDIGVYEKDLDNVPYIRELKKLALKGVKLPSFVDKEGYVWETSRPNEGRHYRVQASRINRLHVDIFPFYPRNGIMTKDTWLQHKQDMEFPESYLKPLTKISFVGTTASAPNNIRDFLEMKFGAGCIENPQYPNPSLIAYPSVQPSEPPST